jgi:peroxiredoxin
MLIMMLSLPSLSETTARLRRESGAPFRDLYDALVQRLADSATAEGALKVGDAFPEFALPEVNGRFALSSELLRNGPLVVNFYRGRWCPYCSATVEAMSAAAPAISAAGATVIGISPELGALSFSAGDNGVPNFKMLCDVDNGLALQCGLLFRLTDDIIAQYLARGLDLSRTCGNDSWFLPIPASYIVAPDGAIKHAFVNPDFRYRMAPEEILRVVATAAVR